MGLMKAEQAENSSKFNRQLRNAPLFEKRAEI